MTGVVIQQNPSIVEVVQSPQQLALEDQGVQIIVGGGVGVQGPKGDPGLGLVSSDNLPEGSSNLFFTEERAAAAAPVQRVNGKVGDVTLTPEDIGADAAGAAFEAYQLASADLAAHAREPDPHDQYLDQHDVIDGGNF